MYMLSVRTQNELAFFRNIVGLDSVERKKAVSHDEEQPFLIYTVRGF